MATKRGGDVDPVNIKPGPQNPSKYPAAPGPNYQKFGEVQGYSYNPYTDSYHADKKAYEEYMYTSGQAERPKGPPSLMDTVLPIAAVGGAAALAEGAGKGISGLFGSGGTTAAAGEVAKTTAPTALNGLQGLSGMGPAAPTGLSANVVPLAETPAGMFDLGGIGSAGNVILPAAGAFGAYDLFSNKKSGGKGALQGAASGAAMGSFFGLPGAAIGAGIGGLTGFFGNFGDEDKYKTEGNRLKQLQESGVAVPQGLIDSMPQAGRSKEELIALEKSRPDGNVKFAGSRLESDLRPQDIVGYAAFAENDPNWFSKPQAEQLKVAQQALDAGAVREHHGTIDIDFSKLGQPAPAQPVPAPNATARPTAEDLKRWGR